MTTKQNVVIDNFDTIYQSNSFGPFKIIEDLGCIKQNDGRYKRFVKIKFINTGTERIVRYDAVISGEIYDEQYGIEFNKIFYSLNYGPYYITEYVGKRPISNRTKRFVTIRFLNTGFEYDVEIDSARFGNVRDYTLDNSEKGIKREDFETEDDYRLIIERILKSRWQNIMARCYNPNDTAYPRYGAIGVRVAEYWHDFNNFSKSIKNIKNYPKFYNNPYKYHIDKDYLQQNIPPGQRIYSPETCIFLSNVDNINLMVLMNHNPNEYFGVKQRGKDRYEVSFNANGELKYFGLYSNLAAAINVYHYYYFLYSDFELIPLINRGVAPVMDIEEALKYKIN